MHKNETVELHDCSPSFSSESNFTAISHWWVVGRGGATSALSIYYICPNISSGEYWTDLGAVWSSLHYFPWLAEYGRGGWYRVWWVVMGNRWFHICMTLCSVRQFSHSNIRACARWITILLLSDCLKLGNLWGAHRTLPSTPPSLSLLFLLLSDWAQ